MSSSSELALQSELLALKARVDQLSGAQTTGLTSVAHDATLIGAGTAQSPLRVAPIAFPYPIWLGFRGRPAASDTDVALFEGAVTVAASPAASAYAATPSAAPVTLTLHKHSGSGGSLVSTAVGQVTFAAGAHFGTVTWTASASFLALDRLVLGAPGSQDDTLADVLVSIRGAS